MTLHFKKCTSDDDYAQVSIFFLKHRLELRLDFETIDTVSTLYGYLTKGHLGRVTDSEGETTAIVGYYYGTPEGEYEDTHTVLVDLAILARAKRNTFAFVRGLQQLVRTIREEKPEVRQFQFLAQAENQYLRKLYPKIADLVAVEEDKLRYRTDIDKLQAYLNRFS
ncbi:hypothetical protein ACFQI7_09570 [Paenibacillus allorhizosphaerae]|uniref:GNAT family N-acetyltransferase n=1 Tax=Paenibacillus allorhizosphaerae TaxID=2849866 RepID=A0ABN7TKS3_9BACL|nr:hypothetical protein [Paenibacillus allorhizosphaerae]CAG7644312.1 hypothetical protein PAECIP111802_03225 [Paenibacillus allorhizosphaerae]